MSEEKSFLAKLVSNPTSFSIMVLSAVILIVWLDQRQPHTAAPVVNPSTLGAPSNTGSSSLASNIALNAPAFSGGNTPKVMSGGGNGNVKEAPDLSGLLAGLEEKVAANPSDISKRILLAQTYNELGMIDKSLKTLRKLQAEQPDNTSVQMVLASILSKSSETKDLKESLKMLDKLAKDKSVAQYLVHLYRGNALIREQDHKGAMENWKAALVDMPANDSRRSLLEQRIGELSKAPDNINKKPSPGSAGKS